MTAFNLGDWVAKKSGAKWRGHIVGSYQTDLTECGYAVESWYETGSVQIYPEAALKDWQLPDPNKRPFSNELAERVISSQVKEIDRLTALVVKERNTIEQLSAELKVFTGAIITTIGA